LEAVLKRLGKSILWRHLNYVTAAYRKAAEETSILSQTNQKIGKDYTAKQGTGLIGIMLQIGKSNCSFNNLREL
jgi:hypothetical protein